MGLSTLNIRKWSSHFQATIWRLVTILRGLVVLGINFPNPTWFNFAIAEATSWFLAPVHEGALFYLSSTCGPFDYLR
jgi:hypothetical protein